MLTQMARFSRRMLPTYKRAPVCVSQVGYVWMYCMSMRFAPIFSAMTWQSPVAPTESVESIFSSISGLYFMRISTLEPKPPAARMTAFALKS